MRFVFLGVAAVLAQYASALACSCIGGTREEVFRQSDIIFEGYLEAIEVKPDEDDLANGSGFPPIGRIAHFRIEREIKGVGHETRDVNFRIETGGNCGLNLEAGKTYRVFADNHDGQLSTSSCSGTTELILAAKDRDNRALEAAEEYAKANPDDPLARWRPDRIRSELDDEYFYRDYLKRVEVGAGAPLDWLESAFEAAFAVNDFERAAMIAQRAVADNGDNSDANLMLAKALLELGELPPALVAAERALALDQGSLDARDEAERLRFLVKGEATPGRRDYRRLYAKSLDARDCRAPKADFSESAFGAADFSGAILDGARFRFLVAREAKFTRASLSGARFDKAGKYSEFASEKGVSNFRADFSGANLLAASFAGAEIDAADFGNADLKRADFTGATIQNSAFAGASLDGARFTKASFYSTTMDGANVGAANFSGAEAVNISWRGSDLRRANLSGANLKGGVINCETRLPRGFAIKGSGLIPELPACSGEAQNRDFSGIKWPLFLRLRGLDLMGANFADGEFADAEFQNASLRGADFSAAKGAATFSGADLSGASFRDAEIDGEFGPSSINMDDMKEFFPAATIAGADFTGAKIGADNFIGADETDTDRIAGGVATAIFERARLTCNVWSRGSVDEYERYRADPSKFAGRPEGWGEILRRRSEEAERYLAVEGALVRGLAARWPTIELDENCRAHVGAGQTPPDSPDLEAISLPN